mmetsp:Transcript_8302/g.10793  ORF Transcript_8302/g.10793 Transcript_8302/m.10793 type:complete len:368 (-) Transcript_8302:191-1294(-)
MFVAKQIFSIFSLFYLFILCTSFTTHLSSFQQRRQCVKRFGAAQSRTLIMELPFKKRRENNIGGNLFVDESCIDCDLCRWMAPKTYERTGLKSSVVQQPKDLEAKIPAYQAMVSCPVGAIRTNVPDPVVKEALAAFPLTVDSQRLPGVFYLGHSDRNTAGATAYYIARANGKNIMVDVPRFTERLAKLVEAAGGVSYLYITHKDDLGDHLQWKKRFPDMIRVINRLDVMPTARSFERKLEDDGPWYLDGAGDHSIVWVPGHTFGSTMLLYRPPKLEGTLPETVAFTGDHLAWSERTSELTGFYRYNKAGVDRQVKSMESMMKEEFQWILPGHGRKYRFRDENSRNMLIEICIERMTNGPHSFVEVGK